MGGLWACTEEVYIEPNLYGSLSGKVLYLDTRQPVANALIRLNPSGRSVDTDSSGSFKLDSLPVGSYTVQASKQGFRNESSTINIEFGKVTALDLLMTTDELQNRPPNRPTLVLPATTGTVAINNRSLTLKWKATDPNRDSLTYDVYLFREGESPLIPQASGIRADSLVINNLVYNTTYYWQVVAKDKFSATFGPVWNFRTGAVPDLSYLFVSQTEGGQLQIFAASNTLESIQLTRFGSNWRPIASPNRQEIAFISNVDGETQVYRMNRDGSNIRKVTTVPIAGVSSLDLSFSWSPDGTQLLYPSNDKLYAVRTDGLGLRVVAQAPAGRLFAGCDWNEATGQIVARTTGGNVYNNQFMLLNAATGAVARTIVLPAGRSGNPVFSINGTQLLYSRDVEAFESPQGRQLDARVFLYTLASSTEISLSENKNPGTNDLHPRFDPTGSRIIFTNAPNDGSSLGDILIRTPDGRERDPIFSRAMMPYWR